MSFQMSKRKIMRASVMIVLLFFLLGIVLWRLFDLTVIERQFLMSQSEARILRTVTQVSHRGNITDRNGNVLAISIPVDSVWVNPRVFKPTYNELANLAQYLNIPVDVISARIMENNKKYFLYLKRQMPTATAELIQKLKIKGLSFDREYRRYYPDAEVDSHVVGFTNVDDNGQEGLELAYNNWLSGTPGERRVIKDRLGHVIADVAELQKPVQGKQLTLSIDQRIQYVAYRDLKIQVEKYSAANGSVVVLDTKTGEILAMANVPSYNPNNRPTTNDARYRNLAVTDMFEPGSTIKPFNIALALKSGRYTPDSQIDTNPGWMMVDGHTINDDGVNYGVITLTQLLEKSSNIGATKVMFSLSPDDYRQLLQTVGFGVRPGTGFPGESPGMLPYHTRWAPTEIASMAFGYGLSVSTLQLAKAYMILADNGVMHPVSLLKLDPSQSVPGEQVLDPMVASTVLNMMRAVVNSGTGKLAQVPGYLVSGKTGTAYIAGPNGYDKKNPKYMSSFVGIAPASNPRLVVAVTIRDPKKEHFGAYVAAPLFSQIMGSALRILNIAPDDYKASS
jgi:cell division protein FtsI (penicillin-binding protein 3)